MLTAMTAVENILNGVGAKDNIWAINTEMEYQEESRRYAPDPDALRRAAGKKLAAGESR